ncbi:MAG: peptidoglycan DD-metalloendopeptidase family protein [Vicinamibacterales bacterium]|nr:peptidoglycan DD-metalloendopeptidase family protein [Vicinamibacterales bacterium]
MSDPLNLQSILERVRAGEVAAAPNQPDREKVIALAQEFESLLMHQMVRQMRQSMLDEPEEDDMGLGRPVYTDVVDGELTRQLSQSGGFGLAAAMLQAFERQVAGQNPAPAAGQNPTPMVGAPTPAAGKAPAQAPNPAQIAPVTAAPHVHPHGTPDASREISIVGDAKVTSAFGWRQDPFHGHSRFHAGVDLRAAYGKAVPSVSEGTVAFAGEQGAYGLTVVVDHGNGLTTRYAHLSSLDVTGGETVGAGQQVGRVGQTGRATAPHLHFEVFRNGRVMDPAQAAEHFSTAGLKLVSLDVD